MNPCLESERELRRDFHTFPPLVGISVYPRRTCSSDPCKVPIQMDKLDKVLMNHIFYIVPNRLYVVFVKQYILYVCYMQIIRLC